MTDRLQKAMQHIDELPSEMQDEIAAQIEDMLAPRIDLPTYAGALADLPDDNDYSRVPGLAVQVVSKTDLR